MEIYETLLFEEADIQYQIDTILSFLTEVHPQLEAKESNKYAVEIRPILREGKSFKHSRSLLLWSLDERSTERLEDFLRLHNGAPTCLYYSVFTLDSEKKTYTKKGTPAVKGKINLENSMYTNEIVLDFDHISEEERDYFNNKMNEVEIFPMWVFTGHGYQAHLLLHEPIYDKQALLKFVYLFRSKGFPVDSACVDPARVMRLPFTYNCKHFKEKEHIERTNPILCELMNLSKRRYDVLELDFLINQLPTVSEEELKELESILGQKKSISSALAKEQDHIEIKENKVSYPHVDNYNIPEAICKMLICTPENYRNKALGFMIKYFLTQYRMSKKQIYEILSCWRQHACVPPMDKVEFEADFSRLYKYGGLNYDSDLSKKFGIIPFQDMIELKSKEIMVSNEFFMDFPNLDGKCVRLYFAIRLLEHINKMPTQIELAKVLGISDRAVRKTLQEFSSSRHIYTVEGNRKAKIPNTYRSTKIYNVSSGYISFTYNDIKCYITELFEDRKRGNGELKLILYMKFRFKNGEIFMSQKNLGNAIGFEQNSISEIVSKLEEKSFLSVEKRPVPGNKHLDSCVYTLLR